MKLPPKQMSILKARSSSRSSRVVAGLILLLSAALGVGVLKAERNSRRDVWQPSPQHVALLQPTANPLGNSLPQRKAKPQERSRRSKARSKKSGDRDRKHEFPTQSPRTEEEFEGDVEQRQEW